MLPDTTSGLCKRQQDKPSLILCGQFCLLFIFVVPKPDLSDGEIVLCKVGEINIAGAFCAQRTPPGSAQGCAAELRLGVRWNWSAHTLILGSGFSPFVRWEPASCERLFDRGGGGTSHGSHFSV